MNSTAKPSPLVSVHLHAFVNLPDGAQEYTDDGKAADGFCTYVRRETPGDPQQPFDISNEQDHATRADAERCAQEMAHCLFADRDQWEHY